jgi:hypothetical protein
MSSSKFLMVGLVTATVLVPTTLRAEQPHAGVQSSTSQITAAARKPDLKVKVMLRKTRRDGKVFVRMAFRVFNVGHGLAGPSTVGSWCLSPAGGPCPPLDGVYDVAAPVEGGATGVVKLPTPVIPSGGNVVVPGPITLEWPNGNYTIKARADFLDVLVETIENNNSGRAAIAVP